MAMLPSGLLGLVFAALLAAIVASMGSKINSIATIFTLDVYQHLRPDASQSHLVLVGRITAVVALLTAVLSAKPLLASFDQAFQYIQEFTGFFTPGICIIFLLGMFWERCTVLGAWLPPLPRRCSPGSYGDAGPLCPSWIASGWYFWPAWAWPSSFPYYNLGAQPH
jgi:Na+/proline symporter